VTFFDDDYLARSHSHLTLFLLARFSSRSLSFSFHSFSQQATGKIFISLILMSLILGELSVKFIMRQFL
jgi:cytochrome c biogenesis factor